MAMFPDPEAALSVVAMLIVPDREYLTRNCGCQVGIYRPGTSRAVVRVKMRLVPGGPWSHALAAVGYMYLTTVRGAKQV